MRHSSRWTACSDMQRPARWLRAWQPCVLHCTVSQPWSPGKQGRRGLPHGASQREHHHRQPEGQGDVGHPVPRVELPAGSKGQVPAAPSLAQHDGRGAARQVVHGAVLACQHAWPPSTSGSASRGPGTLTAASAPPPSSAQTARTARTAREPARPKQASGVTSSSPIVCCSGTLR